MADDSSDDDDLLAFTPLKSTAKKRKEDRSQEALRKAVEKNCKAAINQFDSLTEVKLITQQDEEGVEKETKEFDFMETEKKRLKEQEDRKTEDFFAVNWEDTDILDPERKKRRTCMVEAMKDEAPSCLGVRRVLFLDRERYQKLPIETYPSSSKSLIALGHLLDPDLIPRKECRSKERNAVFEAMKDLIEANVAHMGIPNIPASVLTADDETSMQLSAWLIATCHSIDGDFSMYDLSSSATEALVRLLRNQVDPPKALLRQLSFDTFLDCLRCWIRIPSANCQETVHCKLEKGVIDENEPSAKLVGDCLRVWAAALAASRTTIVSKEGWIECMTSLCLLSLQAETANQLRSARFTFLRPIQDAMSTVLSLIPETENAIEWMETASKRICKELKKWTANDADLSDEDDSSWLCFSAVAARIPCRGSANQCDTSRNILFRVAFLVEAVDSGTFSTHDTPDNDSSIKCLLAKCLPIAKANLETMTVSKNSHPARCYTIVDCSLQLYFCWYAWHKAVMPPSTTKWAEFLSEEIAEKILSFLSGNFDRLSSEANCMSANALYSRLHYELAIFASYCTVNCRRIQNLCGLEKEIVQKSMTAFLKPVA